MENWKGRQLEIRRTLHAETNDIVRKTLIFFIIFDGVYVKMNDQSTSLSTGNIKPGSESFHRAPAATMSGFGLHIFLRVFDAISG